MTGTVEKTNDAIFNEQEASLKECQVSVEKTQREAKAYLDSVRAACATQERIAANFGQILTEASPTMTATAKQAGKLVDILKMLDTQSRIEFDETYRATVLEPLTHYAVLFPDITDLIKKRNNKLLDYDAARSRTKKLVDKPASDSSRLPKAEAEEKTCKDQYDHLNDQLVQGIPEFLQLRSAYLGPSIDALTNLQFKLADDYNRQFETVKIGGKSTELEAEAAMEELRSLDILVAQ